MNLKNRVAELFVDRLNIQVPSDDHDLIETGLLDSITFVDLLMHLESEFGVKISLEDIEIEEFKSLNRISGFIRGKLGSVEESTHERQ